MRRKPTQPPAGEPDTLADPFAAIDPWAPETDVEDRGPDGEMATRNATEPPPEDDAAPVTFATRNARIVRRVMGARRIEDARPEPPAPGESVHFVTFGDVDFTSFLLWLTHGQRLKRLAVSTWAMAATDVDEIRRLVRIGRIERLDAFCGVHSQLRTPQAWLALKECCRSTGGRAVLLRNHSKIAAWHGEAWDGAMESSANLSSNVSMEQTVVTNDGGLAGFYFDTFDRLKSLGSEV